MGRDTVQQIGNNLPNYSQNVNREKSLTYEWKIGILYSSLTPDEEESLTARTRMLTALDRGIPDRLPVTTHHLQPIFLRQCFGDSSEALFWERFGFDPVRWVIGHSTPSGMIRRRIEMPGQMEVFFTLESENWRVNVEPVTSARPTLQISFITPKKTLSMEVQSDQTTSWITDRLIKEKSDIDILADYAPVPLFDVDSINDEINGYNERVGIIRGTIPGFDILGQPGCWQDAAVLFGIEELILNTFDDPSWVHAFLEILQARKMAAVRSVKRARFDLVELGGGDASSTVISPQIFDVFVAPYDAPLIKGIKQMGQRVVYHTCGGMMPILENIADMGPDAVETLTPPSMGGDVNLAEVKSRIGDRVCLIGGFDQFHFLTGCPAEETRKEVRRCFEAAGEGGGFILAPSDHFFTADSDCLQAMVDEAKLCTYSKEFVE